MKIPIAYNLRSLRARPVSTIATAAGMALVVLVFVAMTSMAEGFRSALVATGSAENVLLLRKGADAEMSSAFERNAANIVSALPFVAEGPDGQRLVSPEVYVVVGLVRTAGGMANVVIRGIGPRALLVRKGIKLIDGRMFKPGSNEVIVGKTMALRFPHTTIGDQLHFAGRDWAVVGHFSAQGSAFESEVWGENEQFMPVFRGQAFQSITFRMKDPAAFPGIKKTIEAEPRLFADAHLEVEFYTGQSAALTLILKFIARFIAGIMAIGAVLGAVNTMYAAVASRSREIGVLVTLGFEPRHVLVSFVVEALLISFVGGLLGCLASIPFNGLVTSTTNFSSFSEIAFAFRVTPAILLSGLIFALVMGFFGGLLPARRAARQRPVEALREV